jgi:hypothetical protein
MWEPNSSRRPEARGFRRVPDAFTVDWVFRSFSYRPGTQPLLHPWRWFESSIVFKRRVRSSTPLLRANMQNVDGQDGNDCATRIS